MFNIRFFLFIAVLFCSGFVIVFIQGAMAEKVAALTIEAAITKQKLRNGDLSVYKHHVKGGLYCDDCHGEGYISKGFIYRVDVADYDNNFCFRCHKTYGEAGGLAYKTEHLEEEWGRNPHNSHLGELECSECHRIHEPSKLKCAECHKADWEQMLPSGWLARASHK